MAYPVTLNGRTYTLADFEGQNYVDGLPDAFEDFVTHAGDIYNDTSTSSVAIGTGSKTFTVSSGKPYQAGTPLRIADSAAPSTNFLDAVVTSYSGTTLVVDAIGYAGSGTKTSWTINIGGAKTVDGTLGISQGGTGATTASAARDNLGLGALSTPNFDGLNSSGNITLGDNDKVVFGAGSDLEIFHDGTDNKIVGDIDITGEVSITTSSAAGGLTVTSTEAGATGAPDFTLFRDSASPADNDVLGVIFWNGKDDGAVTSQYAYQRVVATDVTAGSEDARIDFNVATNGTVGRALEIDGTGIDVTGTVNADGLSVSSITYPTTDGTNGQVLTTDGSGTLSFADAGGGGFDPDVDSFNIGNDAVSSGTNSVALGHDTDATGTGSVALGMSAQATATGATALGYLADATATYAISIGDSDAQATYAIAIGGNAQANTAATYGVAIGYNAKAQAANAIHINSSSSQTNRPTVAGNMVIETDDARLQYKSSRFDLVGGNTRVEGLLFGSDTAAANTLDDYEEGTFTPVFQGSTTTGAFTYTDQLGHYVKVGNKVTCALRLQVSAITTAAAGNLYIGGLPFTSKNVTNMLQSGAISYCGSFGSFNTARGVRVGANSTILVLSKANTSDARGQFTTAVSAGSLAVNAIIALTITYIAE